MDDPGHARVKPGDHGGHPRGGARTAQPPAEDPRDRSRDLACIPLMLARLGADELLPDNELALTVGDEVLFCRLGCSGRMEWTRNNRNALTYVVTGEQIAAGRPGGGSRTGALAWRAEVRS